MEIFDKINKLEQTISKMNEKIGLLEKENITLKDKVKEMETKEKSAIEKLESLIMGMADM